MGVAIGGSHTVMAVTTIPSPRRTVALITGAMVIIIRPLTMTQPQEPMGGNKLLMGRTGRLREGLVTTLTPGPMREAHPFRHLMAVEVQPRPIIHILGPMLRPDKARVRTRSGAVPTCRVETKALPWAITRPLTER